jgi:nitrite reductase (NADH) large subunit
MANSELPKLRRVLIIGNGMVGHRLCELLSEPEQSQRLTLSVVGEEPRVAYDRVHLTQYLTDRDPHKLALATRQWYESRDIQLLTSQRVATLNTLDKEAVTDTGLRLPFDAAVFATGSRPFVPNIPGVDLPGAFVYRTIEDLDAIAAAAIGARTAAVIGGGLLGLEAAKALLDLGLSTHVIEAASRLMPRQLDEIASQFLLRHIEKLGVQIHLDAHLSAIGGDDRVREIQFVDEEPLDVDLVVISAGIRPRDELARSAGVVCHARGGIIVDNALQTSAPDVYAIGECARHDDNIYGLVGPGYAMAKTLARHLNGDASAVFNGADTSTQLKLLGIDVASFGDAFADEHTHQSVALQNHVTGIYQKLALSADGSQLLGGILVGDASRYAQLTALQRSGKPITGRAESLLVPGTEFGPSLAASDEDLVCTCNTVDRGTILAAVRDGGCASFADVKCKTRAGTGCGGCAGAVTDLVHAELARQGKATKQRICEHFDFTRQELFELVRIKRYRDFATLIEKEGSGHGCEICKPAVASILASIHNDLVLEHEALQDTNDRYLANIQKRGLYSVVPRIPGGEITPQKLLVIAQVAEKYGLYTKITGGQRIDLFGATLSQLPDIWEQLVAAGFESGHAYGKAIRTVKSCVGSTWCRYGVNDSVSFAIQVENRYKGVRSPHKLKSAVSGCIRECAEAQSKDFGFIATERGWNVYICGNGGAQPRHADLLASGIDDVTAIRYVDRFLMYYIRTADRLMRTSKWVEQLEGGIEHVKDVVINDSLGVCAELEREMQHLVDTYQCEWAEVVNNPQRRAQFREHANDNDDVPLMRPVRGQVQPAAWPQKDAQKERRQLPLVHTSWVAVGRVGDIPKDCGATYRFGQAQIAVFYVAFQNRWYATQARCPHKGDAVLGRGIVGEAEGTPKVACPFHKRTFALDSGLCLSGEGGELATFPVKVENDVIYVELPAVAELERLLVREWPECEHHANPVASAAE